MGKRGQVLWIDFLFLLLFAIFALILISLFLWTAIEVTINFVILYFLFLRVRTEIIKHKRGEIYLMAVVAAAIILLFAGNILPVWKITTLAIVTFILVQLYQLVK